MTETRIPCPYCAEDIRPEAIRCPHCRSRVAGLDPTAWHREQPERRLAGVASATAQGLGVSLPAVRAAFLVLTVFHFLGPILYGALWLVIPDRRGERPPYEHVVARIRDAIDRFLRGSSGGVMPEGPRA